ncbi:MAG: hypothetical protein JW957_03915 [Candidatus Omnitrophica bacterium]|nr:hypothetical protein [Candidatus Omnitrophota bacterium]
MKTCALLSLLAIFVLGIACGGGGGSSAVLPVLPEGILYLSDEGMDAFFEDTPLYGAFGKEYIEVTAALDNSQLPLPANPARTIWAHGVFLFFNCYGEDGVIFAIEPDDETESIARLGVALHPRGVNFTQETLDFIAEEPANVSIIVDIVNRLESGNSSDAFLNAAEGSISLKANGQYGRLEKDDADEIVENLYSQIPSEYTWIITRQQLRSYISQQLYHSAYVNGEDVTLTELCAMLCNPVNWGGLDFSVTANIRQPFSGLMADIDLTVEREYLTGSLRYGNLIYGGELGGEELTGYRILAFPSDIGGREIINTHLEDAGEAGEGFLSFNLTKPSVLYMAVDPSNQTLINWLAFNGWTRFEDNGTPEIITAARPPFTSPFTFHLYMKDYTGEAGYPAGISLPGNGDEAGKMYFVIADAGTYPFGMEIIVSAHTALMRDNPGEAGALTAAARQEGGMVAMSVTTDGETGFPLIHANFTPEFDANVFVNTEGGDNPQVELGDIEDIVFVKHVLENNGFRLIDTYNDLYPAFGEASQILSVERMFGYALDAPIVLPLLRENLYSFTNMNLLNSPNLAGLCLKSIRTDAEGIEIWKDEDENKSLNAQAIMDYLEGNAVSWQYFISSSPNTPVSPENLLKRAGRSAEGELTFDILIGLAGGGSMEIRAGIFDQDYFTNVYDALIGSFLE